MVSQKRARFDECNNCESKRMRDKDVIREAMVIAMTVVVMSVPYMVEHPICIPHLFNKAINKPIYGPEWHKAIRTKLCQLIINGIFHEV